MHLARCTGRVHLVDLHTLQVRLDGCYTLHGPARLQKVGPCLILAELASGAWVEVEGTTDDGTGTLLMPEVCCRRGGGTCRG